MIQRKEFVIKEPIYSIKQGEKENLSDPGRGRETHSRESILLGMRGSSPSRSKKTLYFSRGKKGLKTVLAKVK